MKLYHYNIVDSLEGEVYAENSKLAATEAILTELENRECLLSDTIKVEVRQDGSSEPVIVVVRRKVSFEVVSEQ